MNFSVKKLRFMRLLPGVVMVGTAVLALKTTDLVHEAYAMAETATKTAATALTAAPMPSNADYAGGDEEIASAAEADVLTSLSRRRVELDSREAQVKIQSQILAATEQRVDAKIAQLKSLQDKIAALLVQRDDAQKVQIASLVKTYSAMKPASAAKIFANLPDDVLVPVTQTMKSDVLAPILAAMPAEAAQKLTMRLADKLALPQTTDALAPVAPVAAMPVPGQQSQAAAPVQTASAAPATPPAAAKPAPAAPAAAEPAKK